MAAFEYKMEIAVYKDKTLLGHMYVKSNDIPNLPDMISILHDNKVSGWTHYEQTTTGKEVIKNIIHKSTLLK